MESLHVFSSPFAGIGLIRRGTLPVLACGLHLAISGEVRDPQRVGNKTFKKMLHEIMRLGYKAP
ncbi:hypothetical protein [Leisingera sp. ANG59]|uniref:hypothetical protein n=1 Tax=Leisingera sp. ANG59 TaxID=2675221 RepID=UPI0015720261|nr:hypothetical protein [Leisingera sp. ANG59]NSY38596.1 hypothetical protein [Leisingera sp. ANG59]